MTHSFKIKYGNINAITTCKIFTAKNIYKHLKINAKNLSWIQSFTDIYIFFLIIVILEKGSMTINTCTVKKER